jgi:Na+/H+ antiporter NhaD/arsenite permease-like protein
LTLDLLGIPPEFLLFAATLLGVALLHRRTLSVALIGLGALLTYKFLFGDFGGQGGIEGLAQHWEHHWVELANLGLLLLGFAVLSRHFELSRLPDLAPAVLPNSWLGGLALLGMVFVGSGFLDNIAAALIGATLAAHVYQRNVHIGFLAAIVAAANAGGAGSVVGDTTTTMMWIAGKSPLEVLHAYVGAGVAFVVFAIPAALLQARHAPMTAPATARIAIDWARVGIVLLLLASAIGANVGANLLAPELLHAAPVIGLALWSALLLAAPWRAPDWRALPEAAKGAAFLLALVFAASLMPVERLPAPSWQSAFGLGFISAVFDNIPLTALALNQGGYDWGMLAYAVGFGGSMLWFGSSAGVAVSGVFPEAKSALAWLRASWFVPLAYIAGFAAMLATLGWQARP